MANDVNDTLRRQVADRAYHVCEYCLIYEDDSFWGCEVDHIISRKHGGATEAANLAWACATCNSNKGSDLGTLTGSRAELTRLFILARIAGRSASNCTALASIPQGQSERPRSSCCESMPNRACANDRCWRRRGVILRSKRWRA